MTVSIIVIISLVYLCLLFGIAYIVELKSKQGKNYINNPWIYALSLAVYCTAWTFYGSVGLASQSGLYFLTIYLGPTIGAALFGSLLIKVMRISKTQGLTTLADFISTRYGKYMPLAVLVSILCVIAIIPYISLQIKAISSSFTVLVSHMAPKSVLSTSNFTISCIVTVILASFIMLFGTRSVDVSEKHEGLVVAIAFESIVKLLALSLVGGFVVYYLFDGFGDIFQKLEQRTDLINVFSFHGQHDYLNWFCMILMSTFAIFLLPRQFQISVVENLKEEHINKAMWLFPLYLLLINVFVLPIAMAGRIIFANQPGISSDLYVLTIPLESHANWLGLLTFIGGLSAASGMIIVETIALSTMISNNIVTPLFISKKKDLKDFNKNLQFNILKIRRYSIILILLMALFHELWVAEYFNLVSIGLVSFAGVSQLAPALFGGIFWKEATRQGAVASLIAGFSVWLYTSILPSLVHSGLMQQSIVSNGPWSIALLKPEALMGLTGLDPIAHSFFWSMLINCIVYFGVSLVTERSPQETYQAELFVDIFKHSGRIEKVSPWRGEAQQEDLSRLLRNFIGEVRTDKLLKSYAQRNRIILQPGKADPRMVSYVERILSSVIGAASARLMVSKITQEEELKIEEVIDILRESQQILELNRELRIKSIDLNKATEELRLANQQLRQMDEMKDEFLYTVTHEIRTPLTSIRAMAEILHDHSDMEEDQRQHFLASIIREIERLSHLITQVLNLERFENGKNRLQLVSVDLNEIVRDSMAAFSVMASETKTELVSQIPDSMHLLRCDQNLIRQVLDNLLSNAFKALPAADRKIVVSLYENQEEITVTVEDNGKGIPKELHELVFDKFFQAKNQTLKKPEGSGLGLSICKKIIELHGGKIWVVSDIEKGAKFAFTLPTLITHEEDPYS